MSDVADFEGGLWRDFLHQHALDEDEQEAFLDYVTRPGVPEIDTLDALEREYLDFLHQGGSDVVPE